MTRDDILRYIDYPETLDARTITQLEVLLGECPFFQSARLLHIKNLKNQTSINYLRSLRKAAIYVTDRKKLFYLLDSRSLFCSTKSSQEQLAELEAFDFADLEQITDFGELDQIRDLYEGESYSLEANEIVGNDNDDELDNLLSAVGEFERRSVNVESQPQMEIKVLDDDNSSDMSSDLMSDTLAQIYVKQKHYDKAIAMYEKLSLKYPEKSTYFASQIKSIEEIIK